MMEAIWDLEPSERNLPGTRGKAFLLHLERDLNPSVGYMMVTPMYLPAAGSGTKGGERPELPE
jgi:hypothetical protein